jgi:hypothetical protein
MPTNGLSLVGFMTDQQQAVNHLKTACVHGGKSDPQLIADWHTAQANLGTAFPNAGKPTFQAFSATHQAHLQQLAQQLNQHPTFAPVFAQGASFQLVEIEPLLAFQLTVDADRSNYLCRNLSKPHPTIEELLAVALPLNPVLDEFFWNAQPQSVIVTSRSSNLRLLGGGVSITPSVSMAGIQFGILPPVVYVTQYNGRCYLSNGYHRAYGARLAGATHIPCLFQDVTDYHVTGIRDDGVTLPVPLLESANPPTTAHFTQGRAFSVGLRQTRTVINVNWAVSVVNDE